MQPETCDRQWDGNSRVRVLEKLDPRNSDARYFQLMCQLLSSMTQKEFQRICHRYIADSTRRLRVVESGTELTELGHSARSSWISYPAFRRIRHVTAFRCHSPGTRSEEHTSELQSLMRISYAVFCLKTKIL